MAYPLTQLSAAFIKLTSVTPRKSWRKLRGVKALETAQGLWFQCPKCFEPRSKRGHFVLCWFRNRGVPDDMDPGPGRWTPSGTGLTDLTFVPGEPPMSVSVLLQGGCGWHGFIRDGHAE